MAIFKKIMEIILEVEIILGMEVLMDMDRVSLIMVVIPLKLFVKSASYLVMQPIDAKIGTIHLLFHRETMAEVI